MLVQRNYAEERVIESYTISGVTRADMYKMTQVYDRVVSIIFNHLDKNADRTEIKKSVFEKRKEEIIKMHKEIVDASVEF